jgi:hypothetical protein
MRTDDLCCARIGASATARVNNDYFSGTFPPLVRELDNSCSAAGREQLALIPVHSLD